MNRPPEEPTMQTVDMGRWLPFKFLRSLLRFGSGWFANHALHCSADAAALSLGR